MANVTLRNVRKTYPGGFEAIKGVDVDVRLQLTRDDNERLIERWTECRWGHGVQHGQRDCQRF